MIKAAFIDRDGIINIDNGYVSKKEDVIFVPGIFNLCRLLQEKGFQLVIITNQSGIGRGLYSIEDFNSLMDWMVTQFKNQGITISKCYFCPHHPTEAEDDYKIDCDCRKPKPGMILHAQKDLGIDLSASILVGDKPSDIQAGINAGIPNNFLINSDSLDPIHLPECRRFSNLAELIMYFKKSD